jgi:quercetin dioxygenase-like cupin family protein
MHVEGKVFDLAAGKVLALERAIAHDVEAIEDSALLLNITWHDEIEKV